METPQEEKVRAKLIITLVQMIAFVTVSLIGVLTAFAVLLYKSSKPEPQTAETKPVSRPTVSSSAPVATASAPAPEPVSVKSDFWKAPNISEIPAGEKGDLIRYGREIVVNTAHYFGPEGTVKKINKGMNCQNCHLEGGTKPYANNFGAVAATYPMMRARSGKLETVEMRVNDCFERSLNGEKLPETSKEMQAIKAYILWLGKDNPKGKKPEGTGIVELPYLDRAADAKKGKELYAQKCAHCHGQDGAGQKNGKGGFTFPPLWGDESYNTAAGLYRLSRFAGFVKVGMPQGAGHDNIMLSDAEAWDIAAFVNSQPRPEKKFPQDWPDISKKPVDHPFGAFSDGFSEEQHKYGPFPPILEARKKGK
jgi:thiosulfate dehydrogenase